MDKDKKTITGSLAITLEDTTLEARAKQRHNLTTQHLKAAILFFRHCYNIEKEHAGEPFGGFFSDIRSYVIASVVLSAATLEAYINEIFINIRDGSISCDNINENNFEREWEEIQEKPILKKYKIFLKKSNISVNDTNTYFFPSILIKVRNGLVHYQPKWDYEKTPEEKLESQLRHLVGKIEFSPFVCESAPLFPMRCMTHSFAKWAIETVLDFIKWFDKTSRLENRFEKYRKELIFNDSLENNEGTDDLVTS